MAQDVQRVRYFNGEFLSEGDFNAEQAYHLRMRYLRNRWLHTVGIATGLDVTPGASALQVKVSRGMALCRLTEPRIPEFLNDEVSKELVLPNDTTLDLSVGAAANAQIYVVASFVEQQGQPVSTGDTRWFERPSVRALPPGSPAPDNVETLILARVILDAAGAAIASIVTTERRGAGVRGEVQLPVAGVAEASWPRLRGGAANRIDVSGTLNLQTGSNITLPTGATVDGRDVSTDGTTLDTHVASTSVHVTGGNAHDHTAGNGAPIPFSALTGIPDVLAKAYANVTGASGALNRSFGVTSVSRTGTGAYTIVFPTVANPVFLVSAVSLASLFWRVSGLTNTQATLVFVDSTSAATDPTRFCFLVL